MYPSHELSLTPSIVIPESIASSSSSSSPSRMMNLHHQRTSSNPFEVIYDDLTQKSPPSHLKTTSQLWHNSYNYQEISKNIHQRTPSGAIPITQTTPPILTIIESNSINDHHASGSIISRLATLRHRKNIINRNKTIKKKDIKTHKPLKFPIRRKTSLKYKSINSNNNVKSKFNSKLTMIEYLGKIDYFELVYNLIPSSFKLYKHTKILKPRPKLTFEAFGMSEPESPPSSLKNVKKYDIYKKYRDLIFQGGYRIEELNDVVLNDEELNTRLLFEILIRRTVAAKLEYRLNSAFQKSIYQGNNHLLQPISRSTETISTL